MVSRFAAVEDLGSLAPIKKKKASRVYECSYKVNWLQTYGWWGFVKVKFRWYILLLPISICSSCTSQVIIIHKEKCWPFPTSHAREA